MTSYDVRKLDKRVKRIEDETEVKHIDAYLAATAADVTGFLSHFSIIPQGNTETSRVGTDITVTSVNVKYQVFSVAANTNPSTIRILILRDRQASGQTPALIGSTQGILDNAPITNPVLSPFVWETVQQRFKILYDKVHILEPQEQNFAGTAFVPRTQWEHTKHKGNFKIIYQQGTTTGAIATVVTNSLWFAAISDTGGGNAPTVTYGARIYFKDS